MTVEQYLENLMINFVVHKLDGKYTETAIIVSNKGQYALKISGRVENTYYEMPELMKRLKYFDAKTVKDKTVVYDYVKKHYPEALI